MARAAQVGWSVLWLVCGAALVLGGVALPFLLVLPVFGVLTVRRAESARLAPIAGPIGAAAALLFIAYLNRGPDGDTCTVSGTTTTCSETLNALPWFVLAVLAIGIAATVEIRRRQRSHL